MSLMAYSDLMILVPLFLFLSLSISTNAAFFFDKNNLVWPKNPYGFIGETLKLTCNVTDQAITGNVSGYMYFTKQFGQEERVIPLEYIRILSTRSIRLEYPIRSQEEQGIYVCHLNTSDRESKILGSQYVLVDYHAKPVKNVSCEVYNWQNMTCKWALGQDYINNNLVKVQLVWTIVGAQYDCPHQTKTSCSWKELDGNDSLQPGQTYYMMVFVSTYDKNKPPNNIDEAKSTVFIVDTKLIVKPAPVQDLKVTHKKSTCMSLRWHHHKKKYRNMRYRLQLWRGSIQKTYNNIEQDHKTVCDLHPATDYTIRVSSVPVPLGLQEPNGTYSDWETIIERTLEDVPSDVPGLKPGSVWYHDCSHQTSCRVTVYWQPVPENGSNGEITHYKIRLIERESGLMQEFVVTGSTYSMDLEVKDDRAYTVKVTASTRVGYSGRSTSLIIPKRKQKPAYPSKFLVEAHEKTLYISWNTPVELPDAVRGQNIGYTLYYCSGSKFNFKCQENIQWIYFPPDRKLFEWVVSDDNLDNKLIGISAEKEVANERLSSGIQWNVCTYRKNAKPPEVPNVRFSPEQPNNGLRVEWEKFDCAKTPVYVANYQLTYCRVNSQQGCAGPTENQTVHNTDTSHMIKGLTAGVAYRVTLRAVSKAGKGPESDPIILEVVNNDLKTGELIGIGFAGLFVLILIICSFIFACRKLRGIKKGFYMHVDLPSMATLPPLREGEPLQDPSHHYPGRPLPQVPLSTSTGNSAPGPDDGYSSADTDPSCDPKRAYEPIGKAGNSRKATKRNISISSETALLMQMEDSVRHDTSDTCSPYKVTPLNSLHCNSFSGPGKIMRETKRRESKPYVKKSDSVDKKDNSAQSYAKFALTGYSIDSASPSTSFPSGNDSISGGGSRHTNDPQCHDAQVGFVFCPQTPSFATPTPDPATAPAPAPAPSPSDCDSVNPSSSFGNNISYVTDKSNFTQTRPGEISSDCNLGNDQRLYSRIGSDGSQSPPGCLGYVTHGNAHVMGSLHPAMTSTPDNQNASVRPLSDYMKNLPISYFEEPHSDIENFPTTEL